MLFHLHMCCQVRYHSDTQPDDLKKPFKGQIQPPGGARLLPLLRQLIQVAISYCAASVIFIVLLLILKAIPVCIKCNEINLRYGHRYLWLPVLQGSIYQFFRSHRKSNQILDFRKLLEMLPLKCLDKY